MKRPDNITSYSELSTLAQCEYKHHLRYVEGLEAPPSRAMLLGTIMDRTTSRWWETGDGFDDILDGYMAEYEIETGERASLNEEPWITAHWLLERYTQHYEHMRQDITIVEHQIDVVVDLPFGKQKHRAIIDSAWRDPFDDYWMVERKTYGRKDRLELVTVDPQLTLNFWAIRQANPLLNWKGIVFDGIYTYRWKRDPHPTSDSFDMLWLDRNEEHIQAALADVKAGITRRTALRGGARPMRNIGPLCKGCQYKATCFERLAFPNTIEVDDD